MSVPSFDSRFYTSRELRAERILLRCRKALHVSPEQLERAARNIQIEIEPTVEDLCVRIIADLSMHLLGLPDDPAVAECTATASVQIPADWWQAVRERWAPAWWLRRHPVITREVSATRSARAEAKRYRAVCPHVATEGRARHLCWLADADAFPFLELGS